MVGLIATTLLAGARMPAGATSNMKRKIPRDAADRIAVAGPERDVRNLVPFLRREKCFFLTSPFIEPHFRTPSAPKGMRGRSSPTNEMAKLLARCFARLRRWIAEEIGEEGKNYPLQLRLHHVLHPKPGPGTSFSKTSNRCSGQRFLGSLPPSQALRVDVLPGCIRRRKNFVRRDV